jgi:hypothetical protein
MYYNYETRIHVTLKPKYNSSSFVKTKNIKTYNHGFSFEDLDTRSLEVKRFVISTNGSQDIYLGNSDSKKS